MRFPSNRKQRSMQYAHDRITAIYRKLKIFAEANPTRLLGKEVCVGMQNVLLVLGRINVTSI